MSDTEKGKDWTADIDDMKASASEAQPDVVRKGLIYGAGVFTGIFFLLIMLMLFVGKAEEAKIAATVIGPWMTIFASMITWYFVKR